MIYKSWQDKRPGWSYRVRWYTDGNQHRLKFETPFGWDAKWYETKEDAQAAFDKFRDETYEAANRNSWD